MGIPSETQKRTLGRRAIHEQTQRQQLLVEGPLVYVQYILGNGVRHVVGFDIREVKGIDGGIRCRALIEGPLTGPSAFA